MADAAALTAVTCPVLVLGQACPVLVLGQACPVLVLGQEGDDVRPVGVARRYAQALPQATLEVLPAGGVAWTHRDRLRGGWQGEPAQRSPMMCDRSATQGHCAR